MPERNCRLVKENWAFSVTIYQEEADEVLPL